MGLLALRARARVRVGFPAGVHVLANVLSRSNATRNLKVFSCLCKAMKKSVDRREEMDYKFLPLSSSKSGFEHGIKKDLGGAPCRKNMNPIELIFGRIFLHSPRN